MTKSTRTSVALSTAPHAALSVGIDIAKETFDAAIYRADDSYVHGSFDNNTSGIKAFCAWLRKQKAFEAHCCMEATGRYWEELAYALHEQGERVSVVNPSRTHAYPKSLGQRTKTDKADARYIAHFCAKQEPEPWLPPTPERRSLQSLTRHLEDLKEDRQRYRNRLKALPPAPAVRKSLEEAIAFVDEQIRQTQKEIDELASSCAEFTLPLQLLCSIPGIGKHTAACLLSEIPNLATFRSARELAAYAGLNPNVKQSGKSIGKSRISKQGNKHIRAALFYPAISAMRHNPTIRPFAERLTANGKKRMQCVGAAMRKMLHIVYGVLKSGLPFDPNYNHQALVT